MMRVVCAGHVNWDVTLHVDRLPAPDGEEVVRRRVYAGGGSAANVAAGLVQLGSESVLFGSVGDDDPGRLALRDLEGVGVDCTNVRRVAGETAVKYLIVDDSGEVMVLAAPGVNEAFSASDLSAGIFDGVDILHLTGQSPDTAVALVERATNAGVTVSFDPGRRVTERDYGAVMTLADVVFVTEREARAIGDEYLVAKPGRLVVMKRGSGGAVVRTPSEMVSHDGFAVDSVDTTGAGDSFAAGFLASMDDGVERALAVGNACGAIASRALGARVDLSWEAIESLLAGG